MTDDLNTIIAKMQNEEKKVCEILADFIGPKVKRDELDHYYIRWNTYMEYGLSSKGEFSDLIKDLTNRKNQVEKLRKNITKLPDFMQEYLVENSYLTTHYSQLKAPETVSSSPRAEHESFDSLLSTMVKDFEGAIEHITKIKKMYWSNGTTNGEKVLPLRMAIDVAFLYHEHNDKKLRIGTDGNNGPSTAYTKTMYNLFDIMKVDSHFLEPCRKAISALKKHKDYHH